MIVDVQIDDDTISIAKLVSPTSVRFLEEKSKNFYMFGEPEKIPQGSVCGYYDVEELEDTGLYTKTGNGYEPMDSDSEYEPSESSCESESDVSVIDENNIDE